MRDIFARQVGFGSTDKVVHNKDFTFIEQYSLWALAAYFASEYFN
jgi:hypothetical protein